MSPLREAFAGINVRFHLVGFYTLATLTLRFVEPLSEKPEWFPAIAAAFVVFHGGVCGILGLVYQAAAGRSEPHSFARFATGLFLPILWLSIKISLLVYGLVAAAATGYHLALGTGPFDRTLEMIVFRAGPAIGLALQALALYSMPLCFLWRTEGGTRAHVREGWRFFRVRPWDSLRLFLVLLAIAVIGGTLHYARGPEGWKKDPDIVEALVFFASSYLALVAFFGATRVVLRRPAPDAQRPFPADADAAAPGPPA
jgi:hypothetical protein